MDKTRDTLAQAVAQITDGSTMMIGGFGGSGAPIELIHALIDHGAKDLIVINNNAGNGHVGLAALIEQKQGRKLICSFPRADVCAVGGIACDCAGNDDEPAVRIRHGCRDHGRHRRRRG